MIVFLKVTGHLSQVQPDELSPQVMISLRLWNKTSQTFLKYYQLAHTLLPEVRLGNYQCTKVSNKIFDQSSIYFLIIQM